MQGESEKIIIAMIFFCSYCNLQDDITSYHCVYLIDLMISLSSNFVLFFVVNYVILLSLMSAI